MQTCGLGPLVVQLLGNGLRYRYLRFTGRGHRPQAISLEVTHRCIARCLMCNIWKIPRDAPDLATDEWIRLLRSPLLRDLRELDITGGEPFLRDDLSDLIRAIRDLSKETLPELRSVAITTNGFLTDRVVSVTRKIARCLEDRNIDAVIVCAMDAIGDVHDRIRNVRDGWLRADATIQRLIAMRRECPNLVIGLKTTILPINVSELHRIAGYARKNGLFTIISPCIITGNRYANLDRREDLAFDREARQQMIEFYESGDFGWSYHRDALARFLRTGVMKKPCAVGFNYLFVRHNGDVYPCPLIRAKWGNIQTQPIEELFSSEEAGRFRRRVGRYPECRVCTEPGLERYALPFEGFAYLRLLLRIGGRGFLDLHRHMGLDKYF